MTLGFTAALAKFPHPETLPGEVWLGNIYAFDFDTLAWSTKRLGRMPFSNGTPLGIGNLRPLFVALSEIEVAWQRHSPRLTPFTNHSDSQRPLHR